MMGDKADIEVHRVPFRMRSGEGAPDLERLSWEEYRRLPTATERQRFLCTVFAMGYALYRAGVSGEKLLHLSAMTSASPGDKEPDGRETNSPSSTVNIETQQKLGGLVPCV